MSANLRLALGVALLALGAALPLCTIIVVRTDWPLAWKSAISGVLLLGVEIFAIPAAAIMGKENFARITTGLKRLIGSLRPAGNIGPLRHAAGLVLFLAPVLPTYIMAYLPSWLPDHSPQRVWVNLLADAVFLASLFVLGGDFWDKLRSLFVRESRASFQPIVIDQNLHADGQPATMLVCGMDGTARLYLEDLQVGQRFRSASERMTLETMRRFAAEYDPQPFHLDEPAARASLFDGLVASGWHTACVSMRLLVGGGLPIAGGILGTGGELLWPKPVRPGDTLRVESEVLEIVPSRSKPDRGMVRVRALTLNQEGETVQSFAPRLVVPRRPA